MMQVLKPILVSVMLLAFTNVYAAGRGWAYELLEGALMPATRRPIVDLPDLLPRECYTTPAEREISHNLIIRAAAFEDKKEPEDIKQFLQLLHTAAQYGDPTACDRMEHYCEFSKYGLSPEKAHMYGAQKIWWQSPAELEENRRNAMLRLGLEVEEKLVPKEGNDSTRCSSDGAASGGAGSDSSDGGEGGAVARVETSAGAKYSVGTSEGIRHRKGVAEGAS